MRFGLDPFGATPLGAAVAPPAVAYFDFDLRSYLSAALSVPVYPCHPPQQFGSTSPLPCVTYAQVSGESVYRLSGPLGIAYANYQIDAWSLDYDDVVTLTASILTALDGFRGAMGNTTVLGTFSKNNLSLDDPPADGSDRWTYHRVHEFRFAYRTPIAFG